MSKAPERIWAFNAKQTGYRFYANGPQPEFDNVEYVRADLVEPHVNETPKSEHDAQDVLTPAALTEGTPE